MTEQDKNLFLCDLCGRLPYGVKINYSTGPTNHCIFTLTELNVKTSYDEQYDLHYYPKLNGIYNYFDCLPYLRPMSSMTEEEFESLKKYSGLEYEQLDLAEYPNNYKCLDFYLSEIPADVVILVFDWLNAHHFDYRGLIGKGLAIEAQEGMYN